MYPLNKYRGIHLQGKSSTEFSGPWSCLQTQVCIFSEQNRLLTFDLTVTNLDKCPTRFVKKTNIQSRKRYVTITDSFVTELNNVEPDIIRLKYNKFKFRSTILQKLYTIRGKSVPSHVARPVLYRISTTCVNCV